MNPFNLSNPVDDAIAQAKERAGLAALFGLALLVGVGFLFRRAGR